jgi:uncharacterized protein with GYD domain
VAHDVTLSSLSEPGRKVLRERPGGMRKVKREPERKGARVHPQHAVSRSPDVVTVREAADQETVSPISIETRARGSLNTLTTADISFARVIGRLEQRGHRRGRPTKRRR